jgi:hypothetical protein
MQISAMIDVLSKRAPSIVVFTLCASLLSAWIDTPVWLSTMLAIIVSTLALLLFAARGGRHALKSKEDLGFKQNRHWLAWELAGKGTPPGYYILGFFGFLTIMLTGFQSPYAMPAWAAFVLGIVWGIANRHYPADHETDL